MLNNIQKCNHYNYIGTEAVVENNRNNRVFPKYEYKICFSVDRDIIDSKLLRNITESPKIVLLSTKLLKLGFQGFMRMFEIPVIL